MDFPRNTGKVRTLKDIVGAPAVNNGNRMPAWFRVSEEFRIERTCLSKAALVVFAGITPGQRATDGTRWPPSQVVFLAELPPINK